jgi:hypothetical protein
MDAQFFVSIRKWRMLITQSVPSHTDSIASQNGYVSRVSVMVE